ncbi:hypothetical protein AB833_28200 [Chromatiales bacterium (ex Bugula neritina AB1)]|nr:hypothetical protein AB833_28200 [Chromatiales bacterium (ex Bugula neritina AB1)]
MRRRLSAIGSICVMVIATACYASPKSSSEFSSGKNVNMQASSMVNSEFLPGFIYSSELSALFGLDPALAVSMEEPLLGAVLEIVRGGARGGHVCKLHLFLEEGADIRLPSETRMKSASAASNQLPFSLIEKPGRELKRHLGSQVRQLANLATVRFGVGRLEIGSVGSDDKSGSYVSLPLDSYDKSLFPGVSSVVIPINCAIAADDTFDSVSVFFEKSSSPQDMIINQYVNPEKMTVIHVPRLVFDGMRADMNTALEMDEQAVRANSGPSYRIISVQ